VTAIGGIAIENGKALGRDFPLPELTERFDAVFLSIGLSGVNALGKADEDARGSDDAVEWIAGLRQASNLADVPVGRRVVVIGGGMTAIDAAVQAKALGAEEVTIAYRGPRERMKASAYEQELALSRGVAIRCNLRPHRLLARDGHVIGVEFEHGSEIVRMAADQVMKAIGQTLSASVLDTAGKGPELSGGRIRIDPEGRTTMARVWAGGDCTDRGEDLTVTAVAQGRDAAESIHRFLSRGGK
jgi:glutamate synthase (NADPH/NADH) small chain